MTGNLLLRIYQHKNELVEEFTKKYSVKILVYLEPYKNVHDEFFERNK